MRNLKTIFQILRVFFCCLAGFFGGVDMGFQGNSFIFIGFFVGIVFGLGWSTLLLFVPLRMMKGLCPTARRRAEAICDVSAFVFILIVCFNIWKDPWN